LVGLLIYIGYFIIDLLYALLLAVIVSIFSIMPYLDPIFGAILALLVAMVESKQRFEKPFLF
jgi:predicted PurR-regulated permease PerM